MTEFLNWVSHTALSMWVRESPSIFAYPTILFLHTMGLAFLVGPSFGIVARVLGMAPGLPLAPLEKFFRVMWIGFWINVVSGVVLLLAHATTVLLNWDFYMKLGFITAAVVLLRALRKRLFCDAATPRKTKLLGIALLFCWAGAITAGRLMAYLGMRSGIVAQNN